ncbi:siderophore-interacting protein [Ruania halotolerans]|uniref:siderophore-interacting protein n=1 Tax=Ruania halotolerans TaxID=2897773 RepID=UPI001E4D8C66|nr:siderophore-interacting protein [Ruania halotolerans]UFU07356.1 siderophore-interacting protein [Ruania halotolerans]
MSNITVTHADSGLVSVEVLRRERITPHMTRVTFGGPALAQFTYRGFDQWFRLAIAVHDDDRFDNLPRTFGIGGYLKYLTLPKGTRPVIRSYTVREFRAETLEMDVDFLVHGDNGIAGPWAAQVEPGTTAAFIDQGCGWKPVPAEWTLLVADESGLPAIAAILRDMPRDARGHALIELYDCADQQVLEAPDGMQVHWLERAPGTDPGTTLLPVLAGLDFLPGDVYAFAVGESAVATGARRHLVRERGIPKQNVTFAGYWKVGRAAG